MACYQETLAGKHGQLQGIEIQRIGFRVQRLEQQVKIIVKRLKAWRVPFALCFANGSAVEVKLFNEKRIFFTGSFFIQVNP